MAITRRNAIIGVGTLVAGGGLLAGSGAFSGNANRAVSIEFSDDSNAYLAMGPVKESERENVSVEEGNDGVISIEINRVNANARTVFDNLVAFTNNSPRAVEKMTVNVTDLSRNAELSVTNVPDRIPPGETVPGLGLVVDTRDFVGQPELKATIEIRTVLALEEDQQ